MIVKCKDCKFSVPSDHLMQIVCYRYPPTPILLNISRDPESNRINGTETISISPVMGLEQTCGEATARPSERSKK